MATSAIEFLDKQEFIPVDEWYCKKAKAKSGKDEVVYCLPEEYKIFKHTRGAIILDVSSFYGLKDTPLDYFYLSPKRCYNNNDVREHITHYVNYFERFYDEDKELLLLYYKIKYMMDYVDSYNKEALIYDLKKYFFSGSLYYKIKRMNRDNYALTLSYRNKKDPGLQYTDRHASIMMEISLIMNIIIPLLTHFLYIKKIEGVTLFLLEIYEIIFNMYDVDIYSKLYETSNSNVKRNKLTHTTLWDMQDIRGKNITTHSLYTVDNIILNIMPKYHYNENIINFNYRSVINNTGFQITDISYEFNYMSLSSSKRDLDNNSEFDKFESYLTKADESLYLQNKVNCEETMKTIEMIFGPFNQDEINFYMKNLSDEGKIIINGFQKDLIFNLFYKYFGDPVSIKAINREDYVKLMIAAKRILQTNNMVILPYIISSRMTRIISRKSLNKKEFNKLSSSPFYNKIMEKYNNEKIEKYILSIIATILSSDFYIIDYEESDLHGEKVETIPDIICEEMLMYVSLI